MWLSRSGFAALVALGYCCQAADVQVELTSVLLQSIDGFSATLTLPPYDNASVWPAAIGYTVSAGAGVSSTGVLTTVSTSGDAVLVHDIPMPVLTELGGVDFTLDAHALADPGAPLFPRLEFVSYCIPGWLTLLPPVVALVMAVAVRQVVLALLCGIYVGCIMLFRANPGTALLRTFDTYFVDAFTDDGHAGVLLFTYLLAGVIAIVQKGGGAQGLASLAERFARWERRTRVARCCPSPSLSSSFHHALTARACIRHAATARAGSSALGCSACSSSSTVRGSCRNAGPAGNHNHTPH